MFFFGSNTGDVFVFLAKEILVKKFQGVGVLGFRGRGRERGVGENLISFMLRVDCEHFGVISVATSFFVLFKALLLRCSFVVFLMFTDC